MTNCVKTKNKITFDEAQTGYGFSVQFHYQEIDALELPHEKTNGVLNMFETNRAVKAQEQARSLN